MIDLAENLDEVEQWPRGKAYWDRAVPLTRRLDGETSQEYVKVLGQFADAAGWAEQDPEETLRFRPDPDFAGRVRWQLNVTAGDLEINRVTALPGYFQPRARLHGQAVQILK